jgi:S1-C subfamily serine protease
VLLKAAQQLLSTSVCEYTQIGIMLCGMTIEQMVWGGPAHNSGQLEPGDQILKVDGKDVTEDTFPSVVMAVDTPGSIVTLTVLKSSGQVR